MDSHRKIIRQTTWPATYLISLGFHGASHEQFAYAVMLARFTFPYLMLISLASLLGGILNSLHKFWIAAAAPILQPAPVTSATRSFGTARRYFLGTGRSTRESAGVTRLSSNSIDYPGGRR